MRGSRWIGVLAAGVLLAACGSDPGGRDGASSGSATPPASGSVVVGCPAGSVPDQPGDPAQGRPALRDWYLLAAMEPAGTGIVVVETGLDTWTFDACINTWTEVGDPSPPAHEKRPALDQLVTHPGAGVVLGIPTWWTPVWSYDPGAGSWTSIASSGGGSEAWPNAVYDPDRDHLLAFDPNVLVSAAVVDDPGATGVLAYDVDQRAWTELKSAEPQETLPQVLMDSYDLAYDTAARRLILVITPGPTGKPGRTWRFDSVERTWSPGADIPDTLPNGYPSTGWATAFDPVTERTWLFADTAMLGYDASADDWVVAERDADWPASMALGDEAVDPTARVVSTMVLDPVNDRLVVIGGQVRPDGQPPGGWLSENALLPTDDVWAYQPATNTWTMLLAPSQNPASYGPG